MHFFLYKCQMANTNSGIDVFWRSYKTDKACFLLQSTMTSFKELKNGLLLFLVVVLYEPYSVSWMYRL